MQAPFPPTFTPDQSYKEYSSNYVRYLNLYSTFLRASRRICQGIPVGKCRRQSKDVLRLCDLDDKYSPPRRGRLLSTSDPKCVRDADFVGVRSSDTTIDSHHIGRNHSEVDGRSARGKVDQFPVGGRNDHGIQPPNHGDTPQKPVVKPTPRVEPDAVIDSGSPRADKILATGVSKNDVMFMMIGVGIPPKTCKDYWEKYPILHTCDPSYVMLIICAHFGRKRDLRKYTDECIEKGLVKPAYVP
jgi:hypothetical protein